MHWGSGMEGEHTPRPAGNDDGCVVDLVLVHLRVWPSSALYREAWGLVLVVILVHGWLLLLLIDSTNKNNKDNKENNHSLHKDPI